MQVPSAPAGLLLGTASLGLTLTALTLGFVAPDLRIVRQHQGRRLRRERGRAGKEGETGARSWSGRKEVHGDRRKIISFGWRLGREACAD